MDHVALVPDMVWIKRGIAKHVPDKVKLDPAELRNLIQGGEPETSEQSENDETMNEDEESTTTDSQPKFGIRGSAPDSEAEPEAEGEPKEEGNESGEEDKTKRNAMAGIAMFATPLDDPYITRHVDSDEEEDKEDFQIEPDDNLVVVAKINKGEYGLEIYVYNEKDGDWYVHHDYLLDAPPLCLESILYDPGVDSKKGNLVGVGTMDSLVSIWDLDVVNAVEPVVVLGQRKTAGSKRCRRKRDGSAQGHCDAVLSLAWNRVTDHVLASGSADQTVILWDLEEAKAATVITSFDEKVQCLEWHPAEASILLSGTLNGELAIRDCRLNDPEASRIWKFDTTEIEHLLWDHFNPFYFFVTTDDGKLRYMDSRSDKVVCERDAHEGGARSVAQSFHVRGLISTCGADNKLKLWKLCDNSDLQEIHCEQLGLGALHSLAFSPDSGTVLVVGGEKEDMIRVIGVDRYEPVTRAFSAS